MMLLKQLYLSLNVAEYPRDVQGPFGFRTRYLCNYVERRLRVLRAQNQEFSRLCVEGRHDGQAPCYLTSDPVAVVPIAFDRARYERLSSDELHEFFIGMLVGGLEKCAGQYAIPLREMQECIDEFRVGGFHNEWLHQKRSLRPLGLEARLTCRLEMERFVLTLTLERAGASVFEREILETLPDELIFEHRFKDVVLEGESILVTTKRSAQRTLFALDSKTLAPVSTT
jgi:hypothetical protein